MPVPSSLATLSQTPASNSPAGSDAVFPLLDDYLREMFADFARLRDGSNSWLTSVSGVDTITASCTSIGALVAGQVFRFVAAGANTTAVTLNINGLGAKAVKRPGAVALIAGDIPTFAEVGYNGSTFELLNSKHVALADTATSATTATTAGGVPWSGVTGTPTTAAGYGITDASAAPGDLKHSYQLADHGQWLLADLRTIGNATSGGTARANADTANLFAVLWAGISNANLPIQDSSGAPSTRGASAAADFAANKRLPIPNFNGLTLKGYHNGDCRRLPTHQARWAPTWQTATRHTRTGRRRMDS